MTALYVSRGLPAFYVNVLFIPLEQDYYYIGGVAKKNFVRIVAEQIARTMPDPATEDGRKYRKSWMDLINEVSHQSSLYVMFFNAQVLMKYHRP